MEIPIRRQDRKLTETESRAILEHGEYGVLSMCTPEQAGYGVPLNYALWNNAIYVHCALEGSKLTFIRAHNQVSFCVVGRTELLPAEFGTKYESVIIFGAASEVEAEEKQEALLRLVQKYSPDFVPDGMHYITRLGDKTKIIKISIEHLSGKSRKE